MEQSARRQSEEPRHRNTNKPTSQDATPRHPTAAVRNPQSPNHPITLSPSSGRRIDHSTVPIVASPSGLPTQHLVSARDGAAGLFVAQQWLQPGDRVLLHTHPVEEAITFLSGSGEATLGKETVPIGSGISLYIPAGMVHGFRCTEGTLHVMVVFPTPEFAETTIVESEGSEAG
jgi:quercetin dioxygenase-like cupin family protein